MQQSKCFSLSQNHHVWQIISCLEYQLCAALLQPISSFLTSAVQQVEFSSVKYLLVLQGKLNPLLVQSRLNITSRLLHLWSNFYLSLISEISWVTIRVFSLRSSSISSWTHMSAQTQTTILIIKLFKISYRCQHYESSSCR